MSPPDPLPPETPDPAVLRAEKRLRSLQDLTELGMDFARALGRKTQTEEDLAGPAESFTRISRSVRLTIALEEKTDAAFRLLQAMVNHEVEARRAETVKRATDVVRARVGERYDRIRNLVMEVAEREIDDWEELSEFEDALDERMEDDIAYDDVEGPPLREYVERLCNDMRLSPDWSLWTGEGWPPKPLFCRPKASPFARPSRTRIYDDAGEVIEQPEPEFARLE